MDSVPEPIALAGGTFRVRFLGAEAFPSVYATNLAITATNHEVTLAFFEAMLPLGPAEVIKARSGTSELPARCVARIVISASRLQEMAELLSKVAAQQRPEGSTE